MMDKIEEYLISKTLNNAGNSLVSPRILIHCLDGRNSALVLGVKIMIPLDGIVPFKMCRLCEDYPNCKSMKKIITEMSQGVYNK